MTEKTLAEIAAQAKTVPLADVIRDEAILSLMFVMTDPEGEPMTHDQREGFFENILNMLLARRDQIRKEENNV